MANCPTTRIDWNRGDPLPTSEPFIVARGLNDDRNNAGYNPVARPTMSPMPIRGNRNPAPGGGIDFPTNRFSSGNASSTATTASIKAMDTRTTDSTRNCPMRLRRNAPRIFRTPISRIRLEARATNRLMKLMHAMRRIKRATPENTINVVPFPPCPSSPGSRDHR